MQIICKNHQYRNAFCINSIELPKIPTIQCPHRSRRRAERHSNGQNGRRCAMGES